MSEQEWPSEVWVSRGIGGRLVIDEFSRGERYVPADRERGLREWLEQAVEVLGWIGDDDQPPHSNVDMAWRAREIVDTLRGVLDGTWPVSPSLPPQEPE